MNVPAEPTEAMLQDGVRAYEGYLDHLTHPGKRNEIEAMRVAYVAMLAAVTDPASA